MTRRCSATRLATRRNAVATRFAEIAAKSLKSQQRGSRNAVATRRNAAAAKSLKTQHRGRNAAEPPTYVGEGRPGWWPSFPSLFSSSRGVE